MSTLKVKTVKIDKIEPHPNADKLDLLFIEGWVCIAAKNVFKEGCLAIFFPIDSLPKALRIFAELLPITYLADGLRQAYLYAFDFQKFRYAVALSDSCLKIFL